MGELEVARASGAAAGAAAQSPALTGAVWGVQGCPCTRWRQGVRAVCSPGKTHKGLTAFLTVTNCCLTLCTGTLIAQIVDCLLTLITM